VIVLFDFPPSKGVIGAEFAVFSFFGNVLGAFLCPLFLLPGWRHSGPLASLARNRTKASLSVIVFILILILPIVVIRAFGVEIWLASLPIRSVVAALTGMLHPLCYGLIFLACLRFPPRISPFGHSANRTGYGVFLFALALTLAISARFCVRLLLEAFGIAADPLLAAAIMYNAITVLIAGIGVCSLVCVFALTQAAPVAAQKEMLKGDNIPGASPRTDWPGILGLIGIAAVHKVLSGIMGWRLNPEVFFVERANQPIIFVLVAVLILCGFLAGRSIRIFVRRFLPLALILFIFLPCLVLFDDGKHSGFLLLMYILFAVFSHVVWVVFTAALIELYAGKYWLFGLAIAIYFTHILLYIVQPLARIISVGTEYIVFSMGIAAAVFLLLSFRIIVPKKTSSWSHSVPAAIAIDLEEVFRERGLSGREIEIANLLGKEGLSAKEIAGRLCISTNTANTHIASIFRKFGVSKRAEFMAHLWRWAAGKEQ
jgi:DNA-binding CsgD family transcriptional regulator